jgi:hypothetical protein
MRTTNDTKKIVELRVNRRLSLRDISAISGTPMTTCARVLKKYPLTNEEKRKIWQNKIKGHKRKADGRLESGPEITNQRFGRLVAISRAYSDSNHPKWECQCDCGKRKIIRTDCLINKVSVSCGCYAKDMTRVRLQKDPDIVNFVSLFNAYRNGALVRKIVFNLTESECKFLFKSNCYYCGALPNRVRKIHKNQTAIGRDKVYLYNGIDRKNNQDGYIFNNCVACCTKCNYAKRDNSFNEFEAWIKQLVEYRKGSYDKVPKTSRNQQDQDTECLGQSTDQFKTSDQ